MIGWWIVVSTHSPEERDRADQEARRAAIWSMGKDGRSYWPLKRQAATADRIANHKGRNPQERASLKKRLLRKWMSK